MPCNITCINLRTAVAWQQCKLSGSAVASHKRALALPAGEEAYKEAGPLLPPDSDVEVGCRAERGKTRPQFVFLTVLG